MVITQTSLITIFILRLFVLVVDFVVVVNYLVVIVLVSVVVAPLDVTDHIIFSHGQ